MIDGVILAAGSSSRCHPYKLTLQLGGKTIIEHCIDSMKPYVSTIHIVCGHHYNQLKPILSKYYQIRIIENGNQKSDMFESIKCGIEQIKGDRFFLIPGDYPFIQPKTYEKLLEVHEEIVIPSFNHQKGHPILLNNKCIQSILSNPTIKSLREFLHKQNVYILEIDDEGILKDIDSYEDYLNSYKSYHD